MARIRSAVAAIVASFGLYAAVPASAQGVAEQLNGFGLLGKWAKNCAQPADIDAGNAHATYAMIAAGQAQLRYDYGPRYNGRVYTILAARRLDANRLEITNRDEGDGIVQRTVIRKQPGRIQNFSAQEITGGKIWIRNGVMTANGQTAPWLQRCP